MNIDHIRSFSLLILIGLLLALLVACAPPAPAGAALTGEAQPRPSITRPPTWTPEPAAPTEPERTSVPTRTLTPPDEPGEYQVVVAQNNAFSIEVPANWEVNEGTLQVNSGSTYEMKYFTAISPGPEPQPAVIIFYEWPSSIAVTNENAWESAYALTALALKSCGAQLQPELLPVDFGSEPVFGREYVDTCGAFGLVTGAVHNDVNYGALFEAPVPYYNDWREVLHHMLISLTFGR